MFPGHLQKVVVAALRGLPKADLLSAEIGDLACPAVVETLRFEKPRLVRHGDFALQVNNLARRLAFKGQAAELATLISDFANRGPGQDRSYISRIEADGAYLCFSIGPALAACVLREIIEQCRGDAASDFVLTSNYSALPRCRHYQLLARQNRFNILNGRLEASIFSDAEWTALNEDWLAGAEIFKPLFAEQGDAAMALIMHLSAYRDYGQLSDNKRDWPRLKRYVDKLELLCSAFLAVSPGGEGFFGAHLSVLKARLGLIFAVMQVLSNGLGIMILTNLETSETSLS